MGMVILLFPLPAPVFAVNESNITDHIINDCFSSTTSNSQVPNFVEPAVLNLDEHTSCLLNLTENHFSEIDSDIALIVTEPCPVIFDPTYATISPEEGIGNAPSACIYKLVSPGQYTLDFGYGGSGMVELSIKSYSCLIIDIDTGFMPIDEPINRNLPRSTCHLDAYERFLLTFPPLKSLIIAGISLPIVIVGLAATLIAYFQHQLNFETSTNRMGRELSSWQRALISLKSKRAHYLLLWTLTPLILAQYAYSTPQTPYYAWSILTCFAFLWASYFFEYLKPARRFWGIGILFILGGALVVPIFVGLIGAIPPFNNTTFSSGILDLGPLAERIFEVGLVEELAKILPLIVYIIIAKKRQPKWLFSAKQDALFLGVMLGLGFSISEGVQYANKGVLYFSGADMLFRLISAPVFHACLVGITAYWVDTASEKRSIAKAIVIGFGALLFSATLHGVYNVNSVGLIGLGFAAIIIVTFFAHTAKINDI
jgi:RsiW-degrading membrane proteinase PrsW (M82 family)